VSTAVFILNRTPTKSLKGMTPFEAWHGRKPGVSFPGLNKPTCLVKPARSGSGLPDRFDRKPVKFKIKFKTACSIGSDRLTSRFDQFTGRFDRFSGRFDW
jgi:hypothetical protein